MVTQDAEGRVFHGRILDWNLPNELQNSSFIIRTSLYICEQLYARWNMFPMVLMVLLEP